MLTFFLDSNRLNAQGKCEHMNKLENLCTEDKCRLLMPYTAWMEAGRGNSVKRQLKKWQYYFIELTYSDDQKYWYRRIEKVVFPRGAESKSEQSDVWILVASREMGYPLVTNDGGSKRQPGGILGNASKLIEMGITVIRDLDAVRLVAASKS